MQEISKKLTKRSLFSLLLSIVIIPAIIVVGIYLFDDRKYYLISSAMVILSMVPFFLSFEKRRPQTREIVTIAVLCAIAVAGRLAFFMLPQFKPVVAVVIIAGVCFGAESGFLVGSMTGFVSNFFFGQGPWTPWQMFGFGLIGVLAGVLSRFGILKKSKISLAIFGGLATFFIYGGIVNIGSLLMYNSSPTWKMVLANYISAIPFDVVHAISTVVFLLLFSKPFIEKLERIKVKYGMMDYRGRF